MPFCRSVPARSRGRRPLYATAVVLLALLFASPALGQEMAGGNLAVIVHPDLPVDDLGLRELRRVFLGEQQYWPDRTSITLLVGGAGSIERQVALRLLYRMSEAEYKRYWVARIFRADNSVAPQVVRSAGIALDVVASLPGAIAVVPVGLVDGTVKMLRVDGRMPDEREYGLRH